jgi:hypothetical protein
MRSKIGSNISRKKAQRTQKRSDFPFAFFVPFCG